MTEFLKIFQRGESVELHVETSPASVAKELEIVALEATSYGFRKKNGTHSEIRLDDVDKRFRFDIKLTIKVAATETLDLLMRPEFRQLIHRQLVELNAPRAIDAYESFAASA